MASLEGNTIQFILNGESVVARDVPPNTTLLDWLRHSGRVGSKCGCNEGDCGACTVALLDRSADGRLAWRAINSCITLLPMMAGRELVTVEGVAHGGVLHPVQSCMVKHYGSQCGYCTPGFVMSLFEGFYRADVQDHAQLASQLCGNLCRCTGYRPIRDAAIEAFQQPRRSDRFSDRLRHPAPLLPPFHYGSAGGSYFRPGSLRELFELKRQHPAAEWIAGATEIGVLINKRFQTFPTLIALDAVADLTEIRCTETEWIIGAAATLTAIEEKLAGQFPALDRMLSLFASRQIRNRATLGGNLATASPIGDSAPVLLALDASVVIASEVGERIVKLDEFFTGYRRTVLQPGEILKCVIIPNCRSKRTGFFKVSKRVEMDISTVSAGFALELDGDGVVQSARLAFGGVAPTPVRVRKAEAALTGAHLSDCVERVAAILRDEFQPIDDVRGSAEYRRELLATLWKRFASDEADEPECAPEFNQAEPWQIDSSSRALQHEGAVGHVTGRAEFVGDRAQRRAMLDMWPVWAPHAHARILRRDASRAKGVAGVHAVLFAEDIPGENNMGVSRKDESLLADTDVCYHGHLVAVVVGESIAACRAAAALVEVEYEPLPAVLTISEARAANAFHTELHSICRGTPEQVLSQAEFIIDGELEIGGQEHFYLETHAAWAEVDSDGCLSISSSTQHPSEIQTIVSEVMHIPRNQIVVTSPRMGGGFGGKETQGNTWAALVALAAVKTGRPVRVQLDRDLDMQITGKRHPFWARYRAAHDGDGRLLAISCELISNGGWSLDLSLPVTDRAMFHIDNAYYVPHLQVTGRVAKTNLTSQTAFRGFGGPQGMLVIEEIIDHIARRSNLPPHLVRERNLYHGRGKTNTTHYGQEIEDNRVQDIWNRLKEEAQFEARRASIAEWNHAHANRKRGIAITPVKFGISFTYTPYNQAGALVLIYRDGTVQVNHGGTEMGQGIQTKILGIAIRELGVAADHIRMMPATTDKVPNTSATAASSGSDLNGAAVRNACVQLIDRLRPLAARMLAERFGHPVDGGTVRIEKSVVFSTDRPHEAIAFIDLVDLAYMERISLSATGYYATPDIHWDRASGKGRPFYYFACGAAVSEVEVDAVTGYCKVRRVDILHDAGDSLNPGIDRGQIEGGFIQGMGWLTCEDLRWGRAGRLESHSASTYAIPAFGDAPIDFRVSLYCAPTQPATVHGSKGTGEPPLMLAISVREAIREAVAAFHSDPERVLLRLPATPEAVFKAIHRSI
jgi:xanthine dehydrogenase molybdopterin binding subunit/xanthine dehydrogenase small subunit